MTSFNILTLGFVSVSALVAGSQAQAQTASVDKADVKASDAVAGQATQGNDGNGTDIQDIVVTAQKREERLRDVPMSIVAATAKELQSRGINSTDDLTKLVPGFSSQKSNYGLPVYFIRGVGFFDTTLGVSPAVTVYTDQLPLPYSPMSRGAILDLERVEVLKGPQGTLFGQNSTGGAVNYIAAKPTTDLRAGINAEYGRFDQFDVEGFVSGPITNSLSARVALRHEARGPWQYGYVNADGIGKKDFTSGRLLLEWNPFSTIRFGAMFSAWDDNSETQQPQYAGYDPQQAPPAARPQTYPVSTFPVAPADPRAASWDPDKSFQRRDRFYQAGLRAEIDLSDTLLLTSLTSYAHYRTLTPLDMDATIYPVQGTTVTGTIKSFSQELRMSGAAGPLRWMVGGNYQSDKVFERLVLSPAGSTSAHIGPFSYNSYLLDNNQKIDTLGVFGSLDYTLTNNLTAQASVRYTDQRRGFEGCARDSGNGEFARAFSALASALSGRPQTIAAGACATLSASGTPLPIIEKKLNQDNVAWRASLNWKPHADALLYANVTKGFKAGSFPTLPAANETQLDPVPQESVLAVESGFKVSLADRTISIDGAGFYYDYAKKQLIGARRIPPFGNLPSLVSIPKARVLGAELSVNARPIDGLALSLGGTYVDTKILRDPPNATGLFGDAGSFVGQNFPFTPKWQGVADAQYTIPVTGQITAFFGGSATAKTSTKSTLLAGNPKEGILGLPGYVLLDLRAGIELPASNIRVEVWGRNVTNKLYFTNAVKSSDFIFRFTGMPSTYGVSVRYQF